MSRKRFTQRLLDYCVTYAGMELPIDTIFFSADRELAISVTRNSVGLWDLKTAKLWTTLSDAQVGAIVTHALITDRGDCLSSGRQF